MKKRKQLYHDWTHVGGSTIWTILRTTIYPEGPSIWSMFYPYSVVDESSTRQIGGTVKEQLEQND